MQQGYKRNFSFFLEKIAKNTQVFLQRIIYKGIYDNMKYKCIPGSFLKKEAVWTKQILQ